MDAKLKEYCKENGIPEEFCPYETWEELEEIAAKCYERELAEAERTEDPLENVDEDTNPICERILSDLGDGEDADGEGVDNDDEWETVNETRRVIGGEEDAA